ncbi:MAG: putative RNA uridine N3 methyltransferase [Methanobacteriaceae archaeon]|nr:putative RNA uridine N3 methyltransferase [Methanobacteriaceae archaeon]
MQNQVTLFIPNSFLAETKDLKLKTSKVGFIGRALAVFEVDQIVIYKDLSIPDEKQNNDGDFIAEVLNYMNTPQYLRKKAIPIKAELRHVGILPPLRAPHHPTEKAQLGDFRQGFTVKRNKKGTFVDIGIDKLAFCKEQLSVNKIFSFKITKFAKEVIVTPDEPDDIYWGYKTVSTNKGLRNSLKLINPDLVIETTRYADTIDSVFDDLKDKVNSSKHLAIVFGGPYSSINEKVESSMWDTIKLNTIPNQGTETVRTEEAVFSTLAIFNIM